MRSEFGFLSHLKNYFNLSRVGDDCAIFPRDNEYDYLITSDMLIEDIDFRLEWTTPKFIGHKALAVSVSDIAAMGGVSVYTMLSIGIPEELWKSSFMDEFYEGYARLSKSFETELVGGDISRTLQAVAIDSTVIGIVPKGKAILRSGAKAGDHIFVTGPLGGAAGGLRLLEAGKRYSSKLPSWQSSLLAKQLTPVPKHVSGEIGIASAMIDISDGLSSDLKHICDASGLGARLFAEKIPVEDNLQGLELSVDERLEMALHGGEDFELLFTADPAKLSVFPEFPYEAIGEITDAHKNIWLVKNGVARSLEPRGFEHFSRNDLKQA